MPQINHRHWKRFLIFEAYNVLPNEGGLDNQDSSFVDFMFMCLERKSVHQRRANKKSK
jgi:hypothetical protein